MAEIYEVVEHDGFLWKPRPDATATAEAFIAARSLIVEIHKQTRWSSWVKEDRADEYETAVAIVTQWTCAEPNYHPLDEEGWDTREREEEAKDKADIAAKDAERLARIADYDQHRDEARIALLQLEAIMYRYEGERARLLDERHAANSKARRNGPLTEVDAMLSQLQKSLDSQRARVGDPETVIGRDGRLPADRREGSLFRFRLWRESEGRRLRDSIDELGSALRRAPSRAERERLKGELRDATERLDRLIHVAPQTADEMCSECARPIEWHRSPTSDGFTEESHCPVAAQWETANQQGQDDGPSDHLTSPGGPARTTSRRRSIRQQIVMMPPRIAYHGLDGQVHAITLSVRLPLPDLHSPSKSALVAGDGSSRGASPGRYPVRERSSPSPPTGRRERPPGAPPSALEQPPVPIDREAWSDAFGPLMPELGADVISRAEVFAVAKAWKTTGSTSVLSLLLATVMWSHGNATNRIDGIARMIEDHSTVALKLNDALGRIGSGTEDELRAAYRSFTRPDHVAGLGSALFTKLLYYAGYRHGVGGIQPLILDARIAQGFNRHVGIDADGLPTSMPTDNQWISWLRWAAGQAGPNGEPEDWEYLMFRTGVRGDAR